MIRFFKSKREVLFEIITWGTIVLVTLFVALYFPYSIASSALFYVLIGATATSTFWYLRSRRLYQLALKNAEEVKRKGQELTRQRQTSELIFNHSSEGILMIDSSKRIVTFSKGLEKMSGFKKEELLGKIANQTLEFTGSDSAPSILDIILLPKEQLSQKHYSKLINNSLKTKQDKFIEVEISYDNFTDPTNKNLLGLATLRDITYEKEVRERDREFVSMASHQIFTPLSMIRGFLSIILNDKKNTIGSKQKKYIEQSYLATKRMVTLVMSLLSTSRIEGHKMIIKPSPFDLVELIDDIIRDLKHSEQLYGNKIELNSSHKAIMLDADIDKIGQIITNSLDNAIKYTSKGLIKIELSKKGSKVEIRIVDNGIGIPENEVGHVGSKFFRGSNAMKHDTRGTGLGMFINNFIVAKHHGKLEINSQENVGTTVAITLPAVYKQEGDNNG